MAKLNAFAGSGAFKKNVEVTDKPVVEYVHVVDEAKPSLKKGKGGETFLLGVHLPRECQWPIKDAFHRKRVTMRSVVIKAVNDWMEENGEDFRIGADA